MFNAKDAQKAIEDANKRLTAQEKQTERLTQIMGIVIIVLFVTCTSIAFAYVQFVITESNNRVDTENNLIDKIREQNYKIDSLLQNQLPKPIQQPLITK